MVKKKPPPLSIKKRRRYLPNTAAYQLKRRHSDTRKPIEAQVPIKNAVFSGIPGKQGIFSYRYLGPRWLYGIEHGVVLPVFGASTHWQVVIKALL